MVPFLELLFTQGRPGRTQVYSRVTGLYDEILFFYESTDILPHNVLNCQYLPLLYKKGNLHVVDGQETKPTQRFCLNLTPVGPKSGDVVVRNRTPRLGVRRVDLLSRPSRKERLNDLLTYSTAVVPWRHYEPSHSPRQGRPEVHQDLR